MSTLRDLRSAAIATAANLSRLIAEGADDAVREAVERELQEVQADIKGKAHRVFMVVEALEADAAMFRNDAAQATAQARALESQAQKLKESLGATMLEAGVEKIASPLGTIKIQVKAEWSANPLVSIDELPDELVKKTVNVAAVKKAVENGTDVTGFVSYTVELVSSARLWKKRALIQEEEWTPKDRGVKHE
jgi:prophage DNA circulation protein